VDQFIFSRIRDLSVVYFNRGVSKRILRRFERPPVTFSDVINLDAAKSDLREIIDLLRTTRELPNIGIRYPHGVLLVGPADNNTQLLVQAAAGEAIVPLIMLSIPALVELLIDTSTGSLRLEDLALPVREYTLLKRSNIAERGRRYIQYIFQEAKNIGACLLYLDQLDAMKQLSAREGYDQMLSQLLLEMDGLDRQSRIVVIASTHHPDVLDPSLLCPHRFEHHITIAVTSMSPSMPHTFCLVCRRPVEENWKHCVYCGASLTRGCLNCGAPRVEVEGAHFCRACGIALA
jgi:cell division protease FtsH